MAENVLRIVHERDARASREFKAWNIEKFSPSIKYPSIIIQGEADEYGTLKQVQNTIRQVNSITEKYIIPNVGHTLHKESQDKVLKNATEFINRLIED